MLRIAVTVLALAAAFYVVVLVALAIFQTSLIYPAPRGPAAIPAGFEQIGYRTSDGLDIAAGYRAAEPGKPTILYFHGNGADWQSSVVATDTMVPAGYGVLAAEYRGYRGNPGSPSEEGLYRDGRAAVAWLGERGVAPSDIVVIGNSIGGGVAARIAAETSPAALVLISPFSSLSQLVGEKLWWLPTGWLLRDRYDNVAALAEYGGPVLILHGDRDDLIPLAHAERLAQSKEGGELAVFAGIGHELAWHPDAEAKALAFMERVIASGEDE